MTTLVTGACGFVGAHVVEELARGGLGPVIATDRDPPTPELVAAWGDGITFRPLDVTDATAVVGMLAEVRPRHVVHAAARTPDLDEERGSPARVVAVNVGGAANVLEAAAKAGVERAVVFSSAGVYGGLADPPSPIPETVSLADTPATLYAVTKLAGEGLAKRLVAQGALSIAAIRVAAVYGEHERGTESRREHRTSLIHRLAIATARGQTVRAGGGDPGRDWVHGSDVGRAVVGLLWADRLDHVVFNVSAGRITGWRRVLDLFREQGLVIDETPPHAITMRLDEHRPPLDLTRLVAATGVVPRVALSDGIAALVAHHRARMAA